jgi:deoxyribodipyrimidine photo-lyase
MLIEDDIKIIAANSPQEILAKIGYEYVSDNLWHPENAADSLYNFIENRIGQYKDNRDYMAINGTSLLSPYLRFGNISIRHCYNLAKKANNSYSWVNELIWREFYSMILFHFPQTIDQEFQEKYRNIKWDQDAELFEKFCQGKTGFPIIDAAMRELGQTGKIHNRLRMIVASFMTKDLWLDWRMGEEYFAQHLMDYELSSNVGGWQWSASTGTDAQPYFRIFNPWLQAAKFDPDAKYIKNFVPELRKFTAKEIHNPKSALDGYVKPIVEHGQKAKEAVLRFKNA